MGDGFYVKDSGPVSVKDFLNYAKRYLDKSKLNKLADFIRSRLNEDSGEALLTSEELASFLLNVCGLDIKEVIDLLKFFNLSEEEAIYVINLIRGPPYSR
ncbi:MAG: hypothetical protein B6U69_04070 [Thermofilum sp. ex4484_15]|nr:MAG: hypothetical protein B6U69_04070 [Thermofilum sp. ex4484_15]